MPFLRIFSRKKGLEDISSIAGREILFQKILLPLSPSFPPQMNKIRYIVSIFGVLEDHEEKGALLFCVWSG